MKFHRSSCKKIANISQKLLESNRQSRCSESESVRSKMNDYSSVSSDKDSSSRETSKSPMAMKLSDGEIAFFIKFTSFALDEARKLFALRSFSVCGI